MPVFWEKRLVQRLWANPRGSKKMEIYETFAKTAVLRDLTRRIAIIKRED